MVEILKKQVKKPGTAQTILVVLNLLLFFVGIIIFLIGFATVNKNLFDKAMRLLSKKGLPKPIGNLIKDAVTKSGFASAYLIISGLIVTVVSFLGCCGAWCSKKLLNYYMIFTAVLLLIVGGAGVFTYRQINNAVPYLAEGLGRVFAHYDKPEARKIALIIQSQGKCCGALGPHEWVQDNGYGEEGPFYEKFMGNLEDKGKVGNITGNAPVPDSCCTRPSGGCGLRNNETHVDTLEGWVTEIWEDQSSYEQYMEQEYNKEISMEWNEEDMYAYGDDYYGEYDDYADMYDEHGNVNWDDQDDWSNYDYGEYYDDYYKENDYYYDNYGRKLKGSGRFQNQNQITDPEPNTHIHKYGCAYRYGRTLRKNRHNVIIIFACLAIPEIICLIMSFKVKKYFEEKEEVQEQEAIRRA